MHYADTPKQRPPGSETSGQDRKTKMDSYFFYQANCTDKPMVHIVSSRLTPREAASSTVEVFSNCQRVSLIVNGKSLGFAPADDVRVFRWRNVELQSEVNQIKAIASSDYGVLTDSCEWVLKAELAFA